MNVSIRRSQENQYMEKIKSSIRKELPPLRLYLDELRQIYDTLSEYGAEEIEIETCGYRITDFDELRKLSVEQSHELTLGCRKPHLEVRLANYGGSIYVSEGGFDVEGLVSRIESILIHGRFWYPSLPRNNWIAFILGIPFTLGLLLENVVLRIIGSFFIMAALLWGWLVYVYATRRHSTVVFKLRRDAPNFWQRNKDDLIKLAIGTIIGIVLTKIVDLLLK